MNVSISSLILRGSSSNSPIITDHTTLQMSSTHISYFSAPLVLGVFDHSVVDCSFHRFLSRVSVLSGKAKEVITANSLYRGVLFEEISSEGNGGCILCEAEVELVVEECSFVDVRSSGEGGGMYVRGAVLVLTRSCFVLCRTAPFGNEVGGNGINVGGHTKANLSDNEFNQCWISTDCGDSICLFLGGKYNICRKNSSKCVSNVWGQDTHHGDIESYVESFINTYNCSLEYAHANVGSVGKRMSSCLNIVNCVFLRNLIYQNIIPFYLSRCCFFGNDKEGWFGSPQFSNCIADFANTGITKVGVVSTHRIGLKAKCEGTHLFTLSNKLKFGIIVRLSITMILYRV